VRLILVQPELGVAPDADNFAAVRRTLEASSIAPEPDDLLLLPERVTALDSREEYMAALASLASAAGCAVVGGSHHRRRDAAWVNAGAAVDASGRLLGEYEKVRPYASERAAVGPGKAPGQLVIGGRRVLVLICADFWFSDLFERATALPDIVLVPALSVSRKPTPDYSRALWQHLAVSRAYEFGCFVGVSDWGHRSELPLLKASGVGGLADPSSTDPSALYQPIAATGASAFELNFDALEAFREDRRARGFFWKAPGA
jgi:predicted amidohydrolase